MSTLPHSIGVQRLSIQLASEEMARALLPRIDEIQRCRVVPAIEQALDAVSPTGWRIKLNRVQIDLGTLPFARFEEVLLERLRRELPRALGDAVRAARESPSEEGSAQPEGASRLDLLEHYLLHGTLPFWAPEGAPFSFEARMLEQMARDPARLGQLLRRHCGRAAVLERIVLQLGDAALARLLDVLEPEGAALILAYLVDLRALHRAEPLVELAEEPFRRVLWVLVLHYVLREPGSQFNRKSFVLALLGGLAASEGLELHDLEAALRLGLRETEQHRTLSSSLPAVVGEILADLDRQRGVGDVFLDGAASGPKPRPPAEASQDAPEAAPLSGALAEREEERARRGPWELLEHSLLYGSLPAWARSGAEPSLEALVLRLLETDPHRTGLIVRRHGAQRCVLERIVDELGEASLRALLHALTPESAAPILAYLADLREVHRATPLVPLSTDAFGRRLWVLSLDYVVHDQGSQFNRKSYLRSVLTGMAAAEALEYQALLATLGRVLLETESHRPLGSSFPAVLRELVTDFEREEGAAPWEIGGDALPHVADLAAGRAALREAVLAFLLGESDAPEGPWPAEALLGVLHAMLGAPAAELSAFIARHVTDDRVRERWVRLLPEATLVRLSATLAGLTAESAASIIAYLADLRELHRTERRTALSPAAFGQRFWSMALRDLAHHRGAKLDAKSYLRALLTRMAEIEALDDATLPESMRLALSRMESHRSLGSSLPAILREMAADLEREAGRRAGESAGGAHHDAVLAFLLGESRSPAGPWSEEALLDVLRSMLDAPTAELSAFIARHATDDGIRERWARLLPEPILVRLSALAGLTLPSTEPILPGSDTALREAVMAFLLGEGRAPAGPFSEEALLAALRSMLDAPTAELSAFIARHVTDDRVRARWTRLLPEATLVRLSATLAPRNHRVLIDAAELLSSAWGSASPAGQRVAWDRQAFWSVLLEIFSRSATAEISVERLALELFERFAVLTRADAASAPPAAGQSFLERARRVAGGAGHTALAAALEHREAALLAAWTGARKAPSSRASASAGRREEGRAARAEPRPRDNPSPGKTAFRLGGPDVSDDLGGEAVFIDNAGVVLTAPFLPHLFKTLDMLGQDEKGAPRLRDRETASRAVHMLSYLCDGRTGTPEPALVLAKILCGVPTGAPVARAIDLTDGERGACERLLRSMIAHWKIISNTSIAGLRETFLRREGKLMRAEDRWLLRVQRKTVDVLVDQIPWSIAVVYHAWMSEPLHVTW